MKNIKLILSAHMKPGSGLGLVGGVWFAIPGLEQGLVIDDELRWDKQQGKHSHRFRVGRGVGLTRKNRTVFYTFRGSMGASLADIKLFSSGLYHPFSHS